MEELPSEIARVLHRLGRGWRPPQPDLKPPFRLLWGDEDISADGCRLALVDDAVEITVPGVHDLIFDHDSGDRLRNRPITGELADGSLFSAEIGVLTKTRLGSDGDWFAIAGHYWSVRVPGREPSLWIGRVHGTLPRLERNLVVQEVDEYGEVVAVLGGEHLHLTGRFDYYLVTFASTGEDETFLVIDTRSDAPPTRRDLQPDFAALQFVLGRMLRLDLLCGLAHAADDVVAIVGGRFGRDPPNRARSDAPVPLAWARPCWAAVFFELLSKAYASRPALRLHIPLNFYLEALADHHVEARYLRLHVALESLAHWHLEEANAESERIVDRRRWRDWIGAHEEQIKSLARPGFGDLLVANVKNAHRHVSGRRVVDSAQRLDLELPEEVLAELAEVRRARRRGSLRPVERRGRRRTLLASSARIGLLPRYQHRARAIKFLSS